MKFGIFYRDAAKATHGDPSRPGGKTSATP
jgi:hypothetical protein